MKISFKQWSDDPNRWVPAPKYPPGTLVYSSHRDANVPVLDCHFDTRADLHGWHVMTPGYCDRQRMFAPARADKPTLRYIHVGGNTWQAAGVLDPSDTPRTCERDGCERAPSHRAGRYCGAACTTLAESGQS